MKNIPTTIIILILFIVMGFLWCDGCKAQIIDTSFFLRGVNSDISEFLAPLGTARSVLNADFGRKTGDLNKRKGWSAYQIGFNGQSLNGHYTGLFPYINRDGDRRMFFTFEYDDTTGLYESFPFGFILKTGENNITVSATNSYPYWYYGSDLWATIYNNTAIFSNGFNRPLYFRGNNVRPLVQVPPGSWDMAPFADTSDNTDQLLDGDYSYAFQVAIPCSASAGVQGIYYPYTDSMNLQAIPFAIHVDNDWVVLYAPSLTNITDSLCDPDSTILRFGRTRAGGKYWELDSIFQITILRLSNTDVTVLTHILDSIPDDSLGSANFPFIGFVDTVKTRIADTANDSLYRLGQIQWQYTDSCDGCQYLGISDNLVVSDSIWKYTHYAMVYIDTSTGMMSDIGPTTRIPRGYFSYDSAYVLGVSGVIAERSHCFRAILRSMETLDTIIVPDTVYVPRIISAQPCRADYTHDVIPGCWLCVDLTGHRGFGEGELFSIVGEDGSVTWHCKYTGWSVFDSINAITQIGPWYMVDTLKDSSVHTYVDGRSWGVVQTTKQPIQPGWTQLPMNYPVEMGDYVYMARGSHVYYSERGIEGRWSADKAIAISIDDGDEITGLLKVDGLLYVSKNRSIHIIRNIGLDRHSLSQYVSGIGCIAPKTLINIPTGGFAFLSELGVQSFTPALVSQYKETGANRYSISGSIQDHLDAYSIDDKRAAYMWIDGFYNDLILSFPTLDSSKVMSLNTSQWNTWDIAFKQTGRYTQTQADDLRPSDSILGIFNSSDTIALWGYSDKDSDDTIWTEWRSYWIGDTRRQLKVQLDKIAVQRSTYDTAADFSMVYTVFGWSDTLNEVTLGTHTNTNNTRRDWVGMNVDESDCFEIKIRTGIDSLAVQYMGLQYHVTGTAKEE